MNKLNFLVFLIVVGLLALVVNMASQGDVWAIGILFSLGTIVLISLGAGIVWLTNRQHNLQSNKEFNANMKENLLLMQTLTKVQGEQNKFLSQQVQPPKQLPPASQLIIDENIFNGLTD